MKILKTASGKNKLKLSKVEWQSMGRKAGWLDGGESFDEDEDIYGEEGDLESGLEGIMGKEEEIDDSNVSRRRYVRVDFSDGDNLETAINGTKQEIRNYYLPNGEGQMQDYDNDRPNALRKPVKVTFIE